jgi:hypothetical protein
MPGRRETGIVITLFSRLCDGGVCLWDGNCVKDGIEDAIVDGLG